MSPTVIRRDTNKRREPTRVGRRDVRLWIGIALFVAGIAGLAAQSLVPPSELASKGIRTFGEVIFKDSKPTEDGKFIYTVTFVYADASQRNHQVTRIVHDKGVWDRLKARQEVRVRYLPDRPDEASIEGAEGLARPRSAAFAYLSWSAVLAGMVLALMALRAAAPQQRPPTGQPADDHQEGRV